MSFCLLLAFGVPCTARHVQAQADVKPPDPQPAEPLPQPTVEKVSFVRPLDFECLKLDGYTLKGRIVAFDDKVVDYEGVGKDKTKVRSIRWSLLTAHSQMLVADVLRRELMKLGGRPAHWLTLGAVFLRHDIDETNAGIAFETAAGGNPALKPRIERARADIRRDHDSPEGRLRRALRKPWWTVEGFCKALGAPTKAREQVVLSLKGTSTLENPLPVKFYVGNVHEALQPVRPVRLEKPAPTGLPKEARKPPEILPGATFIEHNV